MTAKPIDIHIHPFTEEVCLGQGPSYTEAHYDFFGKSPDAPHHGKLYIDIDETYQTYKDAGIDKAVIQCIYTERTRELEAGSVVMVTSREPRDEMYHALYERIDITRIGDCGAPGIIASAVFSGHCYAREMDSEPSGIGFRREFSSE